MAQPGGTRCRGGRSRSGLLWEAGFCGAGTSTPRWLRRSSRPRSEEQGSPIRLRATCCVGILVAALALTALHAGAQAEPKVVRVAVLPFENTTGDESYDALSEGLVFLVGGELAQRPGTIVVERRELEHVIREQNLQAGALFDDTARALLSEMLGAEVLVAGSYGKTDSGLRIQLRAVDVDTGAVLGAASGEGEVGSLLDAGRTAAADLAAKLRAAPTPEHQERRDDTPLVTRQMIRGLGYYYQGRLEEALGEFLAVTRSRQTAEMARYWMARTYADLGSPEHCRIECERYLEEYPNGSHAEEIRTSIAEAAKQGATTAE